VTGGNGNGESWQPSGARIGWREDGFVYLDPQASMKAAQEAAGNGDRLAILPQTLHKRLREAGFLITEPSRDELLVRLTVDGATRRVLCLKADTLELA